MQSMRAIEDAEREAKQRIALLMRWAVAEQGNTVSNYDREISEHAWCGVEAMLRDTFDDIDTMMKSAEQMLDEVRNAGMLPPLDATEAER